MEIENGNELIIQNESTGLKISLTSNTESMRELFKFAKEIKKNFFNNKKKQGGSYHG